MKRMFVLVLAVSLFGLAFVQCTSKEEKALALIRDNMFKTLYDFDSYQPVETKIDSAFHTPYNDSLNIKYAIYCSVILDKLEEYLNKADEANRIAGIWVDSYTSYGRGKYLDAIEESRNAIEKAEFLLEQSKQYTDSIRMRSEEINNEFIGWQVTHKFRCKTKGGFSSLSTRVFIMDKKLTSILDEMDVDDEDFQKYQKIIKDVIEDD